jgi:hypothetical protein
MGFGIWFAKRHDRKDNHLPERDSQEYDLKGLSGIGLEVKSDACYFSLK